MEKSDDPVLFGDAHVTLSVGKRSRTRFLGHFHADLAPQAVRRKLNKWMELMQTELKSHAILEACIVCSDGLQGIPDGIISTLQFAIV
jgi:hypothetical protein